MSTTLTGTQISGTYSQLLHVSNGVTSTAKTVYSGEGTATALKIATAHVTVDNVKLDGNTISTTFGNLNLVPDGSSAVVIDNVQINGGTVSGITDLAITDGGTGASSASGARTNLGIGSLGTQDATNVAITGGAISGAAITGGTVTSATLTGCTLPYTDISGRACGEFLSTSDQTTTADTITTVNFPTAAGHNVGATVASNTRITVATTGIYAFNITLQFANTDVTDHVAYVWFRINGADVTASAVKVSVPKSGDGGATVLTTTLVESLVANQYFECCWASDSSTVLLAAIAASSSPYVRPASPSASALITRIG